MKQLKSEILHCLQNLKGSGKFATTGSLPFTIPGLSIDGKKEISFPIFESEIKKLLDFANQAPFGKGSDTITDTTVRNTWEIDAQYISFLNPSWENHVESILKRVKKDLGLKNYIVEAHLYKMLIYEEGGFFLPHKDSEKEKGMFGSLVIGLPSAHTGGELSITFENETVTADFSKNTLYETDYVAFYADCNHEVKRVNSGYRICLVYNLIQKENQSKIEWSSVNQNAIQLASIIKKNPIEKPYIILLGHQYTPENLSHKNLKLNDRLKAEVIIEAAKQLGYYSALCLVTSYKTGSPEYDGYDDYYRYDDDDDKDENNTDSIMAEVHDESLDIEHWENSTLPKFENFSFEENDLITSFVLDEDEPIVKENSGYMGNYGPDLTFWYHYGAVMLWSPSANAELFSEESTEIQLNWIKYFCNTSKFSVKEKNAVDRSIKNFFIDRKEDNSYEKNNYNPVIDWAIFQKKESLIFSENAEQIQFYFENTDAEQWLKLLTAFYENNDWIDKIALHPSIETVGKLSELILLTPNNDEWNAAILQWISLLPIFLEKSYNNKKRIAAETLSDLFKIEKKFSLQNQWASEICKSLEINISRDEIHAKMAPQILGINKESLIRKNLESICINFLQDLVDKKPMPPENWTRELPITKSYSKQWQILEEFLASPTQEIFEYRKVQAERTLMENTISSVRIDLKMETTKKGSPHTLKITKTQDRYNKLLKKWNVDLALLNNLKG